MQHTRRRHRLHNLPAAGGGNRGRLHAGGDGQRAGVRDRHRQSGPRAALGQHSPLQPWRRAQSQDPRRSSAAPNFDDGDRNFSNGSHRHQPARPAVRFGLRVDQAAWLPRERRRMVRQRVRQSRQHIDATANTLRQRTAGRRRVVALHEALRQGSLGRMARRIRVRELRRRRRPVNVKAGQHTVYWGDSLLLGGAIHGVSYSQNSLDVWKGFATPGSEAKELFRPRGGLTLQAQPTQDLSLAGQWFYNWQAIRMPGVGQLPDGQRRCSFGGDSLHLRSQSLCRGGSRRARVPSLVEHEQDAGVAPTQRASATWACPRAGARDGSTARSASTTATRPTSCRSSWSRRVPDRGAGSGCTAIGGIPLGGTHCIVNQRRHVARDLQTFGKLGTYSCTYGDNIHIYGVTLSQADRRLERRCGVLVSQNMPL